MMRWSLVIACVAAARLAHAQPADTPETERQRAATEGCAAHAPTCDWAATFSKLERQSLQRALAKRGHELEPEPWGKVIRRVDVFNEEVFAEKNGLQIFNIFHWTTRESRIRSELTLKVGEVWDQTRVEESARRLHDALYSSVVALVPVKSPEPNSVDLFVITRDIWSLRLNTTYTYQEQSLTNLAVTLAENNLFGTRDVLGASFAMDQDSIAVGPYFLDKNFLNEHLYLEASADEIITRRAGLVFDPITNGFTPFPGDPQGLEDAHKLHVEGNDANISLSRPLWALASEWGGGATFGYSDSVVRSFTGVHGDPNELYIDPDSNLPDEYRFKIWSLNANAVRQWGTRFKQQFTLGYMLSSQQSSLLPSFANADPVAQAMFAIDVFPRSELISQPYVSYSIFEARYRTVRDIQTYELAEDLQDGVNASATVGQGLTALGGDLNFTRPTLSLGWTFPWCHDGFVRPAATVSMRFENDPRLIRGSDGLVHDWTTIDNSASASVGAATPRYRLFRIVAHAQLDTRWHDTQNSYYTIGSDSGLRGYLVNQFRTPRTASGRRTSGQIELRTTPIPWWVFRLGGVAFYEVGGVADSLADMQLYNDVGFGLRFLSPQTSRQLWRFDLAFPLQTVAETRAFDPQFTAGFDSYF
jgi:hypothetical protein